MSCSVTALPVALAYLISNLIGTAFVLSEEVVGEYNQDLRNKNIANAENKVKFVAKNYETPFVDNEVLKKTLEEYGLENINEKTNIITGEFEKYTLKFERTAENEPYKLTIICPENVNTDEKVNEISSEYTLNLQEQSYLSVVENLKKNNMEIEEEEILNDNTIVLTVNLD